MIQMEKEGSGSLASILASDWSCTDSMSLCLHRALATPHKGPKISDISKRYLCPLMNFFLKWNFIKYGYLSKGTLTIIRKVLLLY